MTRGRVALALAALMLGCGVKRRPEPPAASPASNVATSSVAR